MTWSRPDLSFFTKLRKGEVYCLGVRSWRMSCLTLSLYQNLLLILAHFIGRSSSSSVTQSSMKLIIFSHPTGIALNIFPNLHTRQYLIDWIFIITTQPAHSLDALASQPPALHVNECVPTFQFLLWIKHFRYSKILIISYFSDILHCLINQKLL